MDTFSRRFRIPCRAPRLSRPLYPDRVLCNRFQSCSQDRRRCTRGCTFSSDNYPCQERRLYGTIQYSRSNFLEDVDSVLQKKCDQRWKDVQNLLKTVRQYISIARDGSLRKRKKGGALLNIGVILIANDAYREKPKERFLFFS